MDGFFKHISLSIILRNFFAGTVFLVGLWREAFGFRMPPDTDASTVLILASAIALTSGILIYGIHRATLNVATETLRYFIFDIFLPTPSNLEPWKRWAPAGNNILRIFIWPFHCITSAACWYLVHPSSRVATLERWDNRPGTTPSSGRQEALRDWADYIHLLYASSLAILLGAIAGRAAIKAPIFNRAALEGYGYVSIALLVVAFLADCRRHVMEVYAKEKSPATSPPSTPPSSPPSSPPAAGP